jgi:hypothetical protein
MAFLAGFQRRKPIKYGATRPSASLASLPKLFVVNNDADIGAELITRKLAVTLADGLTQVPYGSHSFVSSGGLATFTIRAKFDLSSSAAQGDVLGYLYYDRTASDQANRSGVHDSNCQFFLPLEEDPAGSQPQFLDWRGNYNGSIPSSAASLITAQIAKGLRIDCTLGRVNLGPIATLDGAQTATLSAVMKRLSAQPHGPVVARGNFGINCDNGIFTSVGSGTGVFTLPSNDAWHQYDIVFDGTQATDATRCKLYIDGVLQTALSFVGTIPASIPSNSSSFTIASFAAPTTSDYDDTLLTLTAESAARVAYRYQDQFNNSATFTLGAEETLTTAFVTGGLFRRASLVGEIQRLTTGLFRRGNIIGDMERLAA